MIRPARPGDGPLVLAFVRELAAYEKLADEVRATAEDFERALFDPQPVAEVIFAVDDEDGEVGMALFYPAMSTFDGTPRLYLEDLVVRESARGRGHGRALLAALAALAVARGWRRMEWVVLDWNQPAIDFYERIGARRDVTWQRTVLADDALRRLAGEAAAADSPNPDGPAIP